MLVLSRRRDESLMLGDDIEITVVDIGGAKVRLGITAPAELPVHRKEVYEAIKVSLPSESRRRCPKCGCPLVRRGEPATPDATCPGCGALTEGAK